MADAISIPYVIPLRQVTRWKHDVVGGKAYHLGRLIDAGLPTPEGLCLTTAAFHEFLAVADPESKLRSAIEHACVPGSPALISRIDEFLRLLRATPVPRRIADSLTTALQTEFPHTPVAVRSSATTEDLSSASGAGQHATALNVRETSAVIDAIHACWVSLFEPHAMLYRQRQGSSSSLAAMAVVVQPFIPADTSGVAFTSHPLTGLTDRIVIEACPGLGTSLVSGQVQPDRTVLDKVTLRCLETQPGHKQMLTVPQPAGGTTQATIPPGQQDHPCLTPTQAYEVGRLARQAEQVLQASLDLEWVLQDGSVLLLQARPITTLPRPGHSDPKPDSTHLHTTGTRPDVWSQANAIETFPDVVTPLSWSILEHIIHLCLEPIVERLGARPLQRRFAARIAGRAYLNLSVFEDLTAGIPPGLRFNLVTALGGHEPELSHLPKPPHPGWLHTLRKSAPAARWMLSALPHQKRLINNWINRLDDPWTQLDPTSAEDAALAELPTEILGIACRDSAGRTGAAGAWMAAAAAGASALLFHLTHRWLQDTHGAMANRLLSGSPDMASTRPALDLWQLAAWTRGYPQLTTTVISTPTYAALADRLPTSDGGPEFLERWQALLVRHGHQARSGMDIAGPRWSEMPDYVLGQLRTFLSMDPESGPVHAQARLARERDELRQHLRTRLHNPLKRALLITLARTSQRGMAQRENVKQAGTRMIALLRQVVLEIGRRLVDRGVLTVRDDVFFLHLHELAPALLAQLGGDLQSQVTARKAEYQRNLQISPPIVIVGPPQLPSSAPEPPPTPSTCYRGLGVSPGVAVGKARVILHADQQERVFPGEILVAPFTDPGWAAYFIPAAGLVVDIGGLLSHGSIVAREYGLPAVVNVGPATRQIRTGQTLRVDGNQGLVEVLEDHPGHHDQG